MTKRRKTAGFIPSLPPPSPSNPRSFHSRIAVQSRLRHVLLAAAFSQRYLPLTDIIKRDSSPIPFVSRLAVPVGCSSWPLSWLRKAIPVSIFHRASFTPSTLIDCSIYRRFEPIDLVPTAPSYQNCSVITQAVHRPYPEPCFGVG